MGSSGGELETQGLFIQKIGYLRLKLGPVLDGRPLLRLPVSGVGGARRGGREETPPRGDVLEQTTN